MKFVSIESARGFEIDQPIFVKYVETIGAGQADRFAMAKLVKEEKTKGGIVRTFEVATFTEEGKPPAIKPTLITNVVAVCVPK